MTQKVSHAWEFCNFPTHTYIRDKYNTHIQYTQTKSEPELLVIWGLPSSRNHFNTSTEPNTNISSQGSNVGRWIAVTWVNQDSLITFPQLLRANKHLSDMTPLYISSAEQQWPNVTKLYNAASMYHSSLKWKTRAHKQRYVTPQIWNDNDKQAAPELRFCV